MEKKKKIIVIGIVILVLLIIILSVIYFGKVSDKKVNNNKETKVINKNTKVNKDVSIDSISITNIKVEIIDGLTTFTAKATNNTSEKINSKDIDIIFYENENIIGTIKIETPFGIESKETIDLINYSDYDFTKATKTEYKINY